MIHYRGLILAQGSYLASIFNVLYHLWKTDISFGLEKICVFCTTVKANFRKLSLFRSSFKMSVSVKLCISTV